MVKSGELLFVQNLGYGLRMDLVGWAVSIRGLVLKSPGSLSVKLQKNKKV